VINRNHYGIRQAKMSLGVGRTGSENENTDEKPPKMSCRNGARVKTRPKRRDKGGKVQGEVGLFTRIFAGGGMCFSSFGFFV
jgi:hypothetical protein